MRCICQRRVEEVAKGPGMSLIAEKYRRHVSKLKRLMLAMQVINSQSIMMLFRLQMITWICADPLVADSEQLEDVLRHI